MGMLKKKNCIVISRPCRDIVKFLRYKYGESLTRMNIDSVDVSLLGEIDKESLRKLKISFANKGRKPWNLGKHHKPETVRRIKEKTRLAMCRSDVRKRWEAKWKPKLHSEETKEKLRNIMKQRQRQKMAWMNTWLKKKMGIDMNDYACLPPRFRVAYKRLFNLQWRMHKAKTFDERNVLARSMHEANTHILKLYTYEAKRHKHTIKKRRTYTYQTNSLSIMKRKNGMCGVGRRKLKPKRHLQENKQLIDVTFSSLRHLSRTVIVDASPKSHILIKGDLQNRLTNYGKTSIVFNKLLNGYCHDRITASIHKNRKLKNYVMHASSENLILLSVIRAWIDILSHLYTPN